MEHTPALLASASSQLQKLFETDEIPYASEEEVFRRIASVVGHLLRTDLNRLLHILYRIDVNEQDVKLAMAASSEEEIAENIARLIIKRELQKAQIRLKYSRR
ncbi:hypothetical protein [Pontibacter ruber]|uniref:Uncharacterized protein n=1 Tax=Pontibacter ruber TaxID=1343895 RepID=A0ABW5D3M8_9BACT|nr:hypothetical protein [Pontibacter ruber]